MNLRSVQWIRPIAALTVLALSGPAATGQIVGRGQPISGQINDAATIDLEVTERPLADVIDYIRDQVGVNMVMAPGAEGEVTIEFSGVPWRDALELVVENAGCIVTEKNPRLLKIEKPPRISMSFQDENIKNVIEAIAKAADADVLVSEDVVGQVNLVVNNKPWRDVLDALVKTHDFHVIEEDRGILRVVTARGLTTHLERKTFLLKYLRPKETYTARIQTDYAIGTPRAATGDARSDFELLPSLEALLSNEGKLDYFPDKNAIVVKDTKLVIDEIASFISVLDVEPVQIYIDVKFLSTTNSSARDIAAGFDRGINARLEGASRLSNLPFDLGQGSIGDNLLPGRFDSTTSPIAPGLLDFSATTLAIRLVKDDLDARIMQAPKLVTLDNEPATIFVGETVRYAQAEAASAQAGGLELSIREGDNSPVQTGFQLFVKPHVVPGTNEIMMTVIPEAEQLTGTSDPNLPGFDLFTVGAGASGTGSISLPRIGSQTIVTNMLLENGETGIIGGLVQKDTRHQVTKVPLLGDIPLIGWLFKSQIQSEVNSELLVFITPWIVRSSKTQDDYLNDILEQQRSQVGSEWEALAGTSES